MYSVPPSFAQVTVVHLRTANESCGSVASLKNSWYVVVSWNGGYPKVMAGLLLIMTNIKDDLGVAF